MSLRTADWKRLPPSPRQLREYGAEPRASIVTFSCGRRGRPSAGCEKRTFDVADEIGRLQLQEFLGKGGHLTRPAILIHWSGADRPVRGQVETVYASRMLVADGVVICSTAAVVAE